MACVIWFATANVAIAEEGEGSGLVSHGYVNDGFSKVVSAQKSHPWKYYDWGNGSHGTWCTPFKTGLTQVGIFSGNAIPLGLVDKPLVKQPNGKPDCKGEVYLNTIEKPWTDGNAKLYWLWGQGNNHEGGASFGESGHVFDFEINNLPEAGDQTKLSGVKAFSFKNRGCPKGAADATTCNGRLVEARLHPGGDGLHSVYTLQPQAIPNPAAMENPADPGDPDGEKQRDHLFEMKNAMWHPNGANTRLYNRFSHYGTPGEPSHNDYAPLMWNWTNRSRGGVVRTMLKAGTVLHRTTVKEMHTGAYERDATVCAAPLGSTIDEGYVEYVIGDHAKQVGKSPCPVRGRIVLEYVWVRLDGQRKYGWIVTRDIWKGYETKHVSPGCVGVHQTDALVPCAGASAADIETDDEPVDLEIEQPDPEALADLDEEPDPDAFLPQESGALSGSTAPVDIQFAEGSIWKTGIGVGSDDSMLGDVGGDGKADAISWYRSNGTWYGAHSTGSAFLNQGASAWSSGHGIASENRWTADVGDGKADAIIYDSDTGGWYGAHSNGDGFIGYGYWGTGGVGSSGQFIADVTGDGNQDAVLAYPNGTWTVMRSNRDGFNPPDPAWTIGHGAGPNVKARLVGDVGGDGKADAVIVNGETNSSGQSVVKWYGAHSTGSAFLGYGDWSDDKLTVVGDQYFLADINGDGRDDAVTRKGTVWYVGLSNGDGFDGVYKANSSFGGYARYMVDDVSGDGQADLVNVDPGSGTWQVAVALDRVAPQTTINSGLSEGSILSSSSTTFTFSASEGATFACSFDNAPFSTCSSGHTINGIEDGPHAFEVRATDTAGNVDTSPARVQFVSKGAKRLVGDVTGDGQSDVLEFVPQDGRWLVKNAEGTTFTDASEWLANFGGSSDRQFLADVNGDGKDDAIASWNGGDIRVALSTGTGFSAPALWGERQATGVQKQAATDMTGDGKADLVTVLSGSYTGIYVAASTGTTFGGGQPWSTDVGGTNWLFDDVTGDGRSDAVYFEGADGTWSVRESTGTGLGIKSEWLTAFGSGSTGQYLGDVDGDNRADLVAYRGAEAAPSWSYALSSGTGFGTPKRYATDFGAGSNAQFLADTDGDGKADAVAYFATEPLWSVHPATNVPTASEEFTAETISGCKLWLDANKGATGALGSQLPKWDDSCTSADSAETFTAAAGGGPQIIPNAINGRSVIRFTGTQTMTTSSSAFNFAHGDKATMFIVAKSKRPAGGTSGALLADSWGSSAQRGFLFYLAGDEALYRTDYTSGSGIARAPSNTTGVSTAVMQIAPTAPGATTRKMWLRVDGGATAESTVFAPSTGAAQSPLTLGNDSVSGNFYNGDVAEVIVYNRVLTSAEIGEMEAYLSEKYTDNEAPITSITSGPADGQTIEQTQSTFTFDATEAGGSFECQVDESSWSPCGLSAYTTSSLIAGEHTFQVRATDLSGNTDSTPATRTFDVAHVPTMVANCRVWLDAGQVSTAATPTNPDAVREWHDGCRSDGTDDYLSALYDWGIDGTPTLRRNAENGRPTVHFNGLQYMFNWNSFDFNHNRDATMVVVSRAATAPDRQPVFSIAGGSETNRPVFGTEYLGQNQRFAVASGPNTTIASTGSPRDKLTTTVAQFRSPATNSSGSQSIQVDSGPVVQQPFSGSLLDDSWIYLLLGYDVSGTTYLTGDVAEVIVYDRALTQTELDKIRVALAKKYANSTAPETAITSGPAEGSTTSATPTFEFTASNGLTANNSFECAVDAGPWGTCSSPTTTSSLSGGQHTFRVRAVDEAGKPDASPATRTFTVQLPPPETTITGGPSDGSLIDSASVAFELSNERGVRYECQLDAAAFSDCVSPAVLNNLADGPHTFRARAVDSFGVADQSPASVTFSVDTIDPETTLETAPTEGAFLKTPSVSLAFSTDNGSRFECRVDQASFETCSSPYTTANLPDGLHKFEVRAFDAAGNVDATPANVSFTVDTIAPSTTFTQGPVDGSVVTTSTAIFSFAAGETATYECKYDARADAPCSSPYTTSYLTDGAHTVSVKATDRAGNVESAPLSRSFKVPIRVNFQTATGFFDDYRIDSGLKYAVRGNRSYGWLQGTNPKDVGGTFANRYAASPDFRYNSGVIVGSTQFKWETALPNGTYQVKIVAGEPLTFAANKFLVEGQAFIDGMTTPSNRWLTNSKPVTVVDGKLTVTTGVSRSAIDFIEILLP